MKSTRSRISSIVIAVAISAPALIAQEESLVIHQNIPLSQRQHGVEGSLQVMIDARFTPEMIQEMWGNGDWSFVLPEKDSVYKSFSDVPPRHNEWSLSSS